MGRKQSEKGAVIATKKKLRKLSFLGQRCQGCDIHSRYFIIKLSTRTCEAIEMHRCESVEWPSTYLKKRSHFLVVSVEWVMYLSSCSNSRQGVLESS